MPKAPSALTLAKTADIPADFLPQHLEMSEPLPDVRNIPVRVQQMFCLLAMGWSLNATAKAFRISKQALVQNQQKYDPERKFSLSREARKNMILALAEARASEALVAITPEKLKKSTAVELSAIAQRLARTAYPEDKTAAEPPEKSPVQAILQRLVEVSEHPDQ